MNRYSKIPQTNYNKKRAYRTVRYPEIPLDENDTYVISQAGDRFDMLADQYYGDSTLWWVLSISNPNLPQNSYFPPTGAMLRIPSNIAGVISNFEKINE